MENPEAVSKINSFMIFDIIEKSKKKNRYLYVKRFLDIFVSIIGLIILIPLTIGVYIANKIVNDDGPIFYIQKRIGKDGKTFKMYKFRSMVENADQKLKRHLLDNPEANEEFKKYRKLKDDPRITKVGNFLRKTSLDEFPQFINVLKRYMSLVGPRPYLPREKKIMKKYYKVIIKAKPGLTGPWQVNGRSKTPIEERMLMDVMYVQNENFVNDTKYVLKTIENIIKRDEGAM